MRVCKRCQVKQSKDQFSPHGQVCRSCKTAALHRREASRKHTPTGCPRGRPKALTDEQRRANSNARLREWRARNSGEERFRVRGALCSP